MTLENFVKQAELDRSAADAIKPGFPVIFTRTIAGAGSEAITSIGYSVAGKGVRCDVTFTASPERQSGIDQAILEKLIGFGYEIRKGTLAEDIAPASKKRRPS